MERPEITEITKVVTEAGLVKTLFIKSGMRIKPGQFLMVWLPGLNEKPYAASYVDNSKKEIGITVVPVGAFSDRFCTMKAGDKLGLRGPYGKGYTLDKGLKKVVMTGGGCGAASLTILAEEAVKQGIKVKFILGAKSMCDLLYAERLGKLLGDNLLITTDDGSLGEKGFATDALKKLIAKENPNRQRPIGPSRKSDKVRLRIPQLAELRSSDLGFDKIFACGPERMLKAVVDIGKAAKIPGEISMERYMKCGFGVCGHCCLDPIGIRLCVEGPVISFETAAKITELGSYFRTKSSRKEKI